MSSARDLSPRWLLLLSQSATLVVMRRRALQAGHLQCPLRVRFPSVSPPLLFILADCADSGLISQVDALPAVPVGSALLGRRCAVLVFSLVCNLRCRTVLS